MRTEAAPRGGQYPALRRDVPRLGAAGPLLEAESGEGAPGGRPRGGPLLLFPSEINLFSPGGRAWVCRRVNEMAVYGREAVRLCVCVREARAIRRAAANEFTKGSGGQGPLGAT